MGRASEADAMAGETEAELNKLLEEEEVEELDDLPLEEEDEDAEEHEMMVEAPQQPAPPAGSKKRKAEDVLPVAPEPEEEGSPITAVAEGDLTTDAKAADQDDDHEHDAPSEVVEDLVEEEGDADPAPGAATAAIPWRRDQPPSSSAAPGEDSLIRDGDLVVVYERHDRMKAHRVSRGGRVQNRYGIFEFDDWIDTVHYGGVVRAKQFPKKDAEGGGGGSKKAGGGKQGFVYVLRPSCELWSLVLPHRTQILYIADIATVVAQLRLSPGMRVLESGTGSGSLTHALYRAVAPSGEVFTFEYHELRSIKAREEFEEHGIDLKAKGERVEGEGGVWVEQRDIEQLGFPTDGELYDEGSADAVFLDLPGPWKCIPSVTRCLKVGGMVCSFSPCIEQVQKTLQVMNDEGVYYRMRTMEILLRPYEVRTERVNMLSEPGLALPQDAKAGGRPDAMRFEGQPSETRMMAVPSVDVRGHTGYLTFAQKVKFSEKAAEQK